jgi:endoglucanase
MPRRLAAAATIALMAASSFAANPVAVHGRLRVQGNQVVGEKSGLPAQLTGMSLFWSTWMGQYYNDKTVNWLVDDFHCSVVRAAFGADFVDASGAYSGSASAADITAGRALVGNVVDAATSRGIYAIVDWHSHHAPNHTADAVAFFDSMATKYGQNPNVIFEIFNEPWGNDYTWPQIKAYADTVTKVIRKHSPNLVLVGTRQWSRDVDEASLDPVADTNSAYVFHFYAGSHRDTLTQRGRTALANGAPLFVSEWGTTNEDGGSTDKTVYTDPSNAWFAWIDSNSISSCNWSVSNKDEASAILTAGLTKLSGWDTTTDLTTSGKYVRSMIRSRNTQYTFEPPPIDSSLLPGRIQAETYTKDSALTKSQNSGSDSLYLGNSAVKSWAQWTVNMPQARKVALLARVATDRNTGFTLKINGTQVTKATFGTTGGWGSWGNVTTDSFQVPAGNITVRIDFTDVFDLDWFEFHGHALFTDTGTTTPPETTVVVPSDSTRIQAEDCSRNSGLTSSSNTGSDGKYLGNSAVGSWAEWVINRADPTLASLALRVATDRTTGLTIKINGKTVNTTTFKTTGGWGSWATIQTDSFLVHSGTDTLRIEWTDVFDLDWLQIGSRVDADADYAPPHGDSTRVPASAFTNRSTTSLVVTGTGDAAYLSYSANGNWAEFYVTASRAEKAVFAVRYATPQDTAKVKISVAGTQVANLALPKTGDWGTNTSTWKVATSDSVQVPSGTFTVRLTWVGQFDLNWLEMRAPIDFTGMGARLAGPSFAAAAVAAGLRVEVPAAGRIQVLDSRGRLVAESDVGAGSSIVPVAARGRLFVRWNGPSIVRTTSAVRF